MTAILYVSNLGQGMTEADLRDIFGSCGVCRGVRIGKDQTGEPRGFAFVEMATLVEARTAVRRMAARLFGGRVLGVELIIERNRRRPRRFGARRQG